MSNGWAFALAVSVVRGFHLRGFDVEDEQFENECFLVSGMCNT